MMAGEVVHGLARTQLGLLTANLELEARPDSRRWRIRRLAGGRVRQRHPAAIGGYGTDL